MPMGRVIGISLALMAVSLTAVAKTTDKGQPGHHAKALKAGARSGKPPAAADRRDASSRTMRQHRHRGGAVDTAVATEDDGDKLPDAYLGPTHPVGAQEIGQAAWYGFEGGRTASGERMDGVTPTAAHRSLPLASLAKVTNLDNGRAVVVRINDRGPVSHRFIIDLSRPAARQLGISGTAAVVVEPVAPGPVLAAATPAKPAATAAAKPVPTAAPATPAVLPILRALFAPPPVHAVAAAVPATPAETAHPTVAAFPLLRALFAPPQAKTAEQPRPSAASAPPPKIAASAYP